MLAIVENSLDPSERVRALERAEAAPYLGMTASPWWVPPLFGAWLAAHLASFALWRASELAFIAVTVALCAGMGAFVGWLSQRTGALPVPGRGTPPSEIRHEYRRYAVGAVAIAALVACAWWWAGTAAASVSVFVLTTAGLSLYQYRYERAAASVRERLT